jgi:hypothetical protein
MHVRIVQAGDHRPAPTIDHVCSRPTLPQNLIIRTDGVDFAVGDGDGLGKRWYAARRNLGV